MILLLKTFLIGSRIFVNVDHLDNIFIFSRNVTNPAVEVKTSLSEILI